MAMAHHFGKIFLLGILFLLLCGDIHAQWRNGNAHHGVYNNALIENSVGLNWKFKTNGAVRSTPAILKDKIIIGSSDKFLYCLNKKSGSEIWKFKAEGAISSSPQVNKSIAYFACRKNILYAVDILNGKLLWKKNLGKPLPYEWGFDYYIGSPSIENNIIFIGSTDGNMYALSLRDGKERWRYNAASLIRSTPAVDEQALYFGDCSGKVFALNKTNGKLLWKFSTIGDTLVNEQFGFDRKAVIASPTINGDKLFVGGRDGFLYCLNKKNGSEIWKYDYQVSWIISTAAVKGTTLVTGTSDGRFIHALNSIDGSEIWRFKTTGPVWASPSITKNDIVVMPGNDGYVYALELETGVEVWRYCVGPQIFSSPVTENNFIYFGSDNGYIYSLTTHHTDHKAIGAIKRAVFWMKDPVFQAFRNGMDVYVRDYFIREGYEFYDETDVKEFLLSRIHSDTASVIVFATNYFLPSITNDTLGSNIFREYLRTGGKAVFLGMNPSVYQIDYTAKQVTGLDFSLSEKITGIKYRYKDLRSHGGFYSSTITAEGKEWGLKNNFVGIAGMPLDDIDIPLALDENEKATAWVKKFSTRQGTGFVQLFITPDRLNELPEVQQVAEYGLR